MRDTTFFEQIRQIPFEEEGHHFCNPAFYYETTTVTAVFLTPLKQVRKRLPSPLMKPLRMTPWHALTAITAFEYRDTDVGPYNEVSVAFPVTLGRSAGVFFGAQRALTEPMAYVYHLPVTTEIARYGGVAFYGFPKFIADIEFMRENDWIHCHLAADGKDIFTLSARQLETQPAERSLTHALTVKDGRILRCEVIGNPRRAGMSRKAGDVRLELGDHPIAEDLRELQPGRMMQLQYEPEGQSILTCALESYAA
jgi:hypothetical protein